MAAGPGWAGLSRRGRGSGLLGSARADPPGGRGAARRAHRRGVPGRAPGRRHYAEWDAEYFLSRARQLGPSTEALIAAILADRRHPEQGYRSCQGVLKLFRGANEERAETVSARALAIGALGGRSIASILENNLDRQPAAPTAEAAPLVHANIRGSRYFH